MYFFSEEVRLFVSEIKPASGAPIRARMAAGANTPARAIGIARF